MVVEMVVLPRSGRGDSQDRLLLGAGMDMSTCGDNETAAAVDFDVVKAGPEQRTTHGVFSLKTLLPPKHSKLFLKHMKAETIPEDVKEK